MGDYCLEAVAQKPATVGMKVVTTTFAQSTTIGFRDAATADQNTAVCMLPGTELSFDRPVEAIAAIGLLPNKKIGETVARFCYAGNGKTEHRDALEFPGGKVILLTRLVKGQTATVLQLPVDMAKAQAEHDQSHGRAAGRTLVSETAEEPVSPTRPRQTVR